VNANAAKPYGNRLASRITLEQVERVPIFQIWHAAKREHFREALIQELARWDAEESRRVGLDGSAVVEFFYPGKAEENRCA
jgi:hypothetical protein